MQALPRESLRKAGVQDIVELRRELGHAEIQLRVRADQEAVKIAQAEHTAWCEARDCCLQLERIRRSAKSCLKAIVAGSRERFREKRELAELALREVERWELRESAAYTVVSFARRRDRLRYLRGGSERETVIHEAIKRGGVYDERGHFVEVLQ